MDTIRKRRYVYRVKKRPRKNQRRAVINGVVMTFPQIARAYGIPMTRLYARYRAGLRDEELLAETSYSKPLVNGRSLSEWSVELNIPYQTLYRRMLRGWPADQILRKD